MRLAIFDLDNTLIAGDSDHLWGEFLCRHGHVDAEDYKRRNDAYYEDYKAGRLDVVGYQNFCQEILARTELKVLDAWHQQFMEEFIRPIMLPKARALLDEHRAAGDFLLIITATNRFITGPIARELGVNSLLATECEVLDGHYSGRCTDIPCFQAGKIERLNRWLADTGRSIEGASFYSDSINDLPLLEVVSRPVAVDPDERLRAIAEERGWTVLSLR